MQEAIRLFLQAGGEVDAADPTALLNALGSNVNGIAVNRRRKKAQLAVVLTTDGSAAELDDPSDPEQRIVDGQIARKAISTLLERVEKDELATAIVIQTSDGVEHPADQAKALGRGVREVYNAWAGHRDHRNRRIVITQIGDGDRRDATRTVVGLLGWVGGVLRAAA